MRAGHRPVGAGAGDHGVWQRGCGAHCRRPYRRPRQDRERRRRHVRSSTHASITFVYTRWYYVHVHMRNIAQCYRFEKLSATTILAEMCPHTAADAPITSTQQPTPLLLAHRTARPYYQHTAQHAPIARTASHPLEAINVSDAEIKCFYRLKSQTV